VSNWNNIIEEKDLQQVYKTRKLLYKQKKINKQLLEEYSEKGWELSKEYKDKTVLIQKTKMHDEAFEDRVWLLFYKMKFLKLNRDRNFAISYGDDNEKLTKQIDVLAADDETVVLIECKSTTKPKTSNFKDDIESYKGTMGGHDYYSFMIKPADLLKFSYVLHRNNANNEMMPTYQRLIKKKRLLEINKFINDKGYFPNSIIINIDRDMQFDLASQKNATDSFAKIGLLHLPKYYRSAYIIDGQHRLYGYANTKYANKHTIPIIAFVKLDQAEQVKMFMDINENQKAVPKILRNTLIKDLYLESTDKNKVRVALSLMIAEQLGDLKKSPLYNRVLIGENKTNDYTCITLENLRIAILKNSSFLNKYGKKDVIISLGTFDLEDNDKTVNNISDFLIKSFQVIRDFNDEEWNKGTKDGFLATNNMIMAIIYLLNDFIDIANTNAKQNTVDNVFKLIEPKILKLCDVFSDLTPDQITSFKKAYGAGGPTFIYKELGYLLKFKDDSYNRDWMEKYIEENKQNNLEETQKYLSSIRNKMICILKNKIKEDDLIHYVGEKTYKAVKEIMVDNEILAKKQGKEFNGNFWDVVTFKMMNDILNCGSNWANLFKSFFKDIFPSEDKKKPKELASYLSKIEKDSGSSSIPLGDFNTIVRIDENLDDISISNPQILK
jgi:DNA sulfur modification protein DndB